MTEQVLQALAAGGPLAVVLGYALYTVWGKYQAALARIDQLHQDHSKELRERDRELLELLREERGDTGSSDRNT